METPVKQEDISKKVMDGFRLAHKPLVEKAKRDDDTMVIERDGEIVHVGARNLQGVWLS